MLNSLIKFMEMKRGNVDAMVCDYCKGNMVVDFNGNSPESGCLPRRYQFSKKDVRWSIPFRNFTSIKDARCPRCNVRNGETHHVNCDEEICPKCKIIFYKCDCGF